MLAHSLEAMSTGSKAETWQMGVKQEGCAHHRATYELIDGLMHW